MKTWMPFFLLLFVWSACELSTPKIEYGSDMCHYCKMSIVGKQHAALAVSTKGKQFKFDAIECLVPYLESDTETSFSQLLVNDYDRPTALIPAEQSYFLISRAIPSPMGAFLSAFSSEERARAMQAEKGGEVYDWRALQEHLVR